MFLSKVLALIFSELAQRVITKKHFSIKKFAEIKNFSCQRGVIPLQCKFKKSSHNSGAVLLDVHHIGHQTELVWDLASDV